MPNSVPQNYDYDLFISYRRVNDVRKWVENVFLPELYNKLQLDLGRDPRIFWDTEAIEKGELWRSRIPGSIKKSACLVAILSKPYFASHWCVAEWESFIIRSKLLGLTSRGQSLIVPIRYHDGSSYPRHVHELTPFDLSSYRYVSPAFAKMEAHVHFEHEMQKLSERIAIVAQSAPPCRDDFPFVEPANIRLDTNRLEVWDYRLTTPDHPD